MPKITKTTVHGSFGRKVELTNFNASNPDHLRRLSDHMSHSPRFYNATSKIDFTR